MSIWGKLKSAGSSVVNAVEHPLDTIHGAVQGTTNALGLTNPTPASPANSPDAQAARDFAAQLRARYMAGGGGVAPAVAPVALDQAQADQARAASVGNIQDLQGVASGATRTAADSLYQQGTDEAAARARGLAAAYSRANPGAALRAGLGAADQAQAQATSGAAIQKANEQAAARGQLGTFAGAVRGADLDAASKNQATGMQAQQLNQNADLQEQQINNQNQLGFATAAANETNAPIAAQIANQTNTIANNKANQEGTGSFYTGLSSAILSDERTKTNVRPRSLADALAEKVHGVSYQYSKESGEAPGQHVGVIAQDLEKALPGVVAKDKAGMRRVDTSHLTMANTGALAEIAKRLRALESRR